MIAQYSNQETLTIVCRYTGIQAQITLPKVGKLTLEYTHPLSHIDSALEASNRQDFMRRLDNPVLSGILITLLRSTKLLAQSKDHPSAINAQISKASKSYLIKAIELVRRHLLPLNKTHFLPKVVFDCYESQGEANRAIEAVVSTLVSELLDDARSVDQIRNYFRAHSRATTYDGYSRELALERAAEADAIKQEAIAAELERKADQALRKLERQRAAKEGMLSRRERAQKLKIVVQSTDHKLAASRIAVLQRAARQADLLPAEKLSKLQLRIEELIEEYEDEATQTVLFAAQSIFTHCEKVLGQSMFSVEEELLGLDTVHGMAKPEESATDEAAEALAELDEPTPASKPASIDKPKAQSGGSLLDRIRAKKAAASNVTAAK